MPKKVTIGMISYNDQKYLEQNLPSLLAMDYENFEVVVCNNNPENGVSEWIGKKDQEVKVVSAGGNIGFGGAHNFMMRNSDAEFYLCFNSDMVVSKDYLGFLVEAIEKSEKIGCVTGKLISWTNFPQPPSEIEKAIIDTTGLEVTKYMKMLDRGQGEPDVGQYEKEEEVFGASGASPLYRMAALKDVAHSDGEFFDKEFFMYKEDVDLAFRLRWAGWKTVYTPYAVSWHDRTAADIKGFFAKIKERLERPEYIKRNSFLNQLIVIKKNSRGMSFATRFRANVFVFKYCLFLMLFDMKILSEIKKYFSLRPRIIKKSKSMPRRISWKEMERWMKTV